MFGHIDGLKPFTFDIVNDRLIVSPMRANQANKTDKTYNVNNANSLST